MESQSKKDQGSVFNCQNPGVTIRIATNKPGEADKGAAQQRTVGWLITDGIYTRGKIGGQLAMVLLNLLKVGMEE